MFSKITSFFQSDKKKFRRSLQNERRRIYIVETPHLNKRQKTGRKGQQTLSNIHIKKNTFLFLLGILLILLFGFIIFTFNGNYFTIKTITITSKDPLSNISIAYNSVDSFRGKNIFTTSKSDIIQKIKKKQLHLLDVKIKRNIPQGLTIELSSYPVLFTMSYHKNNFFLSSNGVSIPSNAINDFPRELHHINIIDSTFPVGHSINYTKISSPSTLNKIYFLVEYIKRNIIRLHIKKIIYYKQAREAHLIDRKNTRFIFDLTGDILQQIHSYTIFKKKYPKKHIYYIDLRINNKVFYCPYSQEYNCKQNLKDIYGI